MEIVTQQEIAWGEGALCLYRENKQVSGKREERGPLKYLTNTHE